MPIRRDDFVRIEQSVRIEKLLDLSQYPVQRTVLLFEKCRPSQAKPMFAADRSPETERHSAQFVGHCLQTGTVGRLRNRQKWAKMDLPGGGMGMGDMDF